MTEAKRTLKQKAGQEVREYLAIALYLFIVFSLLVLYKSVLLAEYHIDIALHGFALINALGPCEDHARGPGPTFRGGVAGCSPNISDSTEIIRFHCAPYLFQDC